MPRADIRRLRIDARHWAMLRALLARHIPQAEVWAYGSRITGGAHEGSDLDLVLRNPQNLKVDTEGGIDLKEALQESELPMLVDVHDWARLPESFYREIERDHVVVQDGQRGRKVEKKAGA